MDELQLEAGPEPFYLIFKLGVRIQHLGQRLEQETGLSLTQWAILKRLIDQPTASAQALAQAVGIQPGSLTDALKRLKRKSLIRLGKHPADQRRKILFVTRDGKENLDRASKWLEEKTQQHGLAAAEAERVGDWLAAFN